MAKTPFQPRPMTPFEKGLAADLLEMADNEFGNHGCNDFPLPNTVESRLLAVQMAEWNGSPEDLPNLSRPLIYFADFALMGFFSGQLKWEAEHPTALQVEHARMERALKRLLQAENLTEAQKGTIEYALGRREKEP